MHCTYRALIGSAFATTATRPSILPPAFLLPAFGLQTSAFSTSPAPQARKDGNRKMRGVSALRRTGFNRKQGENEFIVSLASLPKPVLNRGEQPKVNEHHGLWEFFNKDKTALAMPTFLNEYGRAWARSELRIKSWSDLHRLWWMCVKEMNRLETGAQERTRVGNIYGAYEHEGREMAVRETMKNIRHTLIQRWYAFEDARTKAMTDPAVDLYAKPGKTGLINLGAQKKRRSMVAKKSKQHLQEPSHP